MSAPVHDPPGPLPATTPLHGSSTLPVRPPRPATRADGHARARAAGHVTGLVTIVVPAKDEAEAIAALLRALPVSTLEAEGFRVETVVLDGHSRDGTPDIARALGATVLPDEAHGKGSAVRNARPAFHGDYVVMVDADGSYAPDAIPRLLEPLAWGDADVVMGDRHALPGAMTPLHRVGNAILSLEASVLYGQRCPDLCTGLWAFRADALRHMPLASNGFDLEAELFAVAARMRLRVAHVDVDYLPRAGTTKLSATRDGARIAWRLVSARFRHMDKTPAVPEHLPGPVPEPEQEPEPYAAPDPLLAPLPTGWIRAAPDKIMDVAPLQATRGPGRPDRAPEGGS